MKKSKPQCLVLDNASGQMVTISQYIESRPFFRSWKKLANVLRKVSKHIDIHGYPPSYDVLAQIANITEVSMRQYVYTMNGANCWPYKLPDSAYWYTSKKSSGKSIEESQKEISSRIIAARMAKAMKGGNLIYGGDIERCLDAVSSVVDGRDDQKAKEFVFSVISEVASNSGISHQKAKVMLGLGRVARI